MTRLALEQRIHRSVSEDELLTFLVEWARIRGWLVHHDRRSDLARQQGDAGFPDLVLTRAGRVVFAEVKRETERATREQMAWILALFGQPGSERPAGSPEFYLWRPSDQDRAIEILR